MAIKREVAYGIVQGISDLWQDEELRDFTVEVGHTKFSCHRFILGACSGFFRGLFRCRMKECNAQDVTLQNISSDTFKLVLEALYTGHGVLTNDNFIDIWHAVNQLQIKFLIQECESFVIKHLSLDNYEEIFHSAKLLSPSFVLDNVWGLIKKNYEKFTKTDTFLGLSFGEIHQLIGGQDLVVKSEDIVLKSILRWVKFGEKKINQLLDESISKEFLTGKVELISKELSDTSLLASSQQPEQKKHNHKKHKRPSGRNQNNQGGDSCQESHDPTKELDSLKSQECHPVKKENDEMKSCPTETPKLSGNVADLLSDETPKLSGIVADLLSDETPKLSGIVADLLSGETPKLSGNVADLLSDETPELSGIVVDLLSAARTCLASTDCLERMLCEKIFIENREAREIVTKALLYQLQLDKRHGQWPSAAIHRDDSLMDHVALVPVVKTVQVIERMSGNDDEEEEEVKPKTLSDIRVYSFTRKNWFKIPIENILGNVTNMQLAVYENTVCYFGCYNTQLHHGRLINGSWTSEKFHHFSESQICIVTMDRYIYILKLGNREFTRFDVSSKAMTSLKSLPDKSVIEHATKFEKKILIFVSQTTEGVDETVTHCYDTVLNEWTRLNNLQGPAIKLTTFKDDQHTYVLQTNGDVWKVVKPQSDVVDFEYVTKLWGCDWTVHGAVTYLDTVYIYGDQSTDHTNDVQVKHAVPGVFNKIVYVDCDMPGCTAFMPATVSKEWLQQLS